MGPTSGMGHCLTSNMRQGADEWSDVDHQDVPMCPRQQSKADVTSSIGDSNNRTEALKRRVEYKYNSKLRPRQFQVADLVMRKAHTYQLDNKLSPKWTGPFRVTEAFGNRAYMLETLEGDAIPRTWNATHLKFYFS